MRRGRSYKPFFGLRLVEEFTGRWHNIGEILESVQRLERKSVKEMEQCLQEVIKHLIKDGVLYR
jgi:hypothetical protein